MSRERILVEIKRTAKNNSGTPLGAEKFFTETGINVWEWRGKYWVRWSDALCEAGFEPNKWKQGYSDAFVIEKFITLTRELSQIPVHGDLEIKARADKEFPCATVFRRFGSKQDLIFKVIEYCREKKGFEDILLLCREGDNRDSSESDDHLPAEKIGYVYLVKHGSRREYKIGKTFNPLRREGEIRLQLPEKLEPLHWIKTDDPSGIETYWHARFTFNLLSSTCSPESPRARR